jgi:hypothetical protein
VGEVDEISQDPKLNVGIPRGRWLDVAVAAALIAAAAPTVMTSRGSRPAAPAAGGPGPAAAPALLPSAVTAPIPLPFSQPGGMTILGSDEIRTPPRTGRWPKMNETCDRCGPAVRAGYRVNRRRHGPGYRVHARRAPTTSRMGTVEGARRVLPARLAAMAGRLSPNCAESGWSQRRARPRCRGAHLPHARAGPRT